MTDPDVLNQIQGDLQLTPGGVFYLEGITDIQPFFGLLGLAPPTTNIHRGVGVRVPIAGSGSGGRTVRRWIDVARRNNLTRVWGIIDGDGEPSSEFDPPHAGPLYRWKTYCIENLLMKVGWPSSWPAIDAGALMASYAPYVALNRMHRHMSTVIETLRLHRFHRPKPFEPLMRAEDIMAALERDKGLIANVDIAQHFDAEISAYRAALAQGADAVHTILDGKWLVAHAAVEAKRRSADECRDEWAAWAAFQGGLPEVRSLWERLTGAPP